MWETALFEGQSPFMSDHPPDKVVAHFQPSKHARGTRIDGDRGCSLR